MYKRYYDGYSGNPALKNHGEIIVPETIRESENDETKAEITSVTNDSAEISSQGCKKSNINLPFELDDLILIGILLFLLFDKDDCKDDDNDIFVLLLIGIIVLSDIF